MTMGPVHNQSRLLGYPPTLSNKLGHALVLESSSAILSRKTVWKLLYALGTAPERPTQPYKIEVSGMRTGTKTGPASP